MAFRSMFPCTGLASMAVTACFLLLSRRAGADAAAAVPAVYSFGDSLADVGNNDYLSLSVLKANFPHNGVDYPGGKATGRFSNGKNSADYIAEMIGVASPPPYLSIPYDSSRTRAFLQGLNFASGGAGVLDITNPGQCLSFSKQIEYFSAVYTYLVQQLGSDQTRDHLAKSIFSFIVGSNDIFDYVRLNPVEHVLNITPEDFVDSMLSKLGEQLKALYNLGARKFAFVGTAPLGCCPSFRDKATGSCNAKANSMSLLFNAGVAPLLQGLKYELGDMNYSFFNSSLAFSTILTDPNNGFTEVKAACCGLGNLNAKAACLPVSSLCPNRSNHAFWDLFHPSQRFARMLTTTFFQGSAPYVFPMNLKELSNLNLNK